MGFSDYLLSCSAIVLPVLGTLLFGYNAYLQVVNSNDPVESSFSLAVFATFLLSVVSIGYARSSSQGSNQRKLRTTVWLFMLIAAAFLVNEWVLLPKERRWVVVAACGLPVAAGSALLLIYRKLLRQRRQGMGSGSDI